MARHLKMLLVLPLLCLTTDPARCEPPAEVSDNEIGAPTPSLEFPLRDEFESELDPNWEILRSDPTHFSVTKNPGKLTITTQHGTIHRKNRPAPLAKNLTVLKNPVADDAGFVVTTCLEGFAPTDSYQQAGLMIYLNDDNYLKWVYEFGTGGRIVWNLLRETGGKSNYTKALLEYDPKQTVWLRLTARGNYFEYASSDDGQDYQVHGELPWKATSPPRVGLIAKNGGSRNADDMDARFDFFEVRGLTAKEREQPAFLERRALAGPWDVVSCQAGGKPLRVASISGFVFSDTEVTVRDKQKAADFEYTLDVSKEPKAIRLAAFTGEGRGPALGIYSLSGDSLQICLELQSKIESPDSFETRGGDHRMLLKLKRAESPDED